MRSERIVGMAMCGLLALGGQAVADDGLGVGRGIDHVGMLVRLENFDAAGDVLARQLGFSVTPVLLSPAGVENRLIWFDDLSYLELDAFTERNAGTAPFLDFLEKHEGAKFYGTEVIDAARAVRRDLRGDDTLIAAYGRRGTSARGSCTPWRCQA